MPVVRREDRPILERLRETSSERVPLRRPTGESDRDTQKVPRTDPREENLAQEDPYAGCHSDAERVRVFRVRFWKESNELCKRCKRGCRQSSLVQLICGNYSEISTAV
jgi:hypothetical protein